MERLTGKIIRRHIFERERKLTYNILYQADQNYIIWGGVSILSLFINNKNADEINVHFLCSGVNQNIKDDFLKMASEYGRNIFFYDTDDLRKELEEQNTTIHCGSFGTYYKLFLKKFCLIILAACFILMMIH